MALNSENSHKRTPSIAIIGAGISGLCTGVGLQKQLGIHDFVIFDENEDVGGTWLVNRYPGCASDVPSHFYSFSFQPNPYWTESFASQPEILEYLKDVSTSHNLYKNVRFGHQVKEARWLDDHWSLTVYNKTTAITSNFKFDIIFIAVGGLRVPNIPKEFESFRGPKFHSAEWDSGVDLGGKKVGLVGTGASAVQIIPEIVHSVEKLTVFQRNPPWVVPRMQFSFPNWLQWIFAQVPLVHFMLRAMLFWFYEFTGLIYSSSNTYVRTMLEGLGKGYLKFQYRIGNKNNNNDGEPKSERNFKKEYDKCSAKDLVPSYSVGCKRITPSDHYYKSLANQNAQLVTQPIKKVLPNGILTKDGQHHQFDILILATGFRVQDFFAPMQVFGEGDVEILRKWREDGPSGYYGILSKDMPNAFGIIGPHSPPGYTSAVFTAECCVNWSMKVIGEMIRRGQKVVTVRADVEEAHMKEVRRKLKNTIWSSGGCKSYYQNDRGMVTTLNPDSALKFWRNTRTVNFDHLKFPG